MVHDTSHTSHSLHVEILKSILVKNRTNKWLGFDQQHQDDWKYQKPRLKQLMHGYCNDTPTKLQGTHKFERLEKHLFFKPLIICTKLFQTFDHLLLLTQGTPQLSHWKFQLNWKSNWICFTAGKLAYCGPADEAAGFFSSIGKKEWYIFRF